MWEVWRCPHCKNYYEEVAINEHREVCPDGITKTEKVLPEGGVQERTTGSDSVEGTT